jgi:hypothetical protein
VNSGPGFPRATGYGVPLHQSASGPGRPATAAQTLGQIRAAFEAAHPGVTVNCKPVLAGAYRWHAEWKTLAGRTSEVKRYEHDRGFEFFQELEQRVTAHPPIES